MPLLAARSSERSVPVWFVTSDDWQTRAAALPPMAAAFARASGFEPRAGRHCILPDAEGGLAGVLFAIEAADARYVDPFLAGKLATILPAGLYRFADALPGGAPAAELAALGWCLSAYRFTRYKAQAGEAPRLVCPDGVDAARVTRMAEGVTLARDLVNTPANDMGPGALEKAVQDLAARHGATCSSIMGDELLAQNFPLIHAVGRAAEEAPRLVDFSWGPEDGLKVTLVGKGVCFDTGGLDIKPSIAMLLMKKDMAGAATALALAHMIMDAKLPVRLRVLVPIVENSIAGNAFRPGDVYPSRKGLNVEIGNTDAEGRLILADALSLAAEENPALLFDFATLTGAARVALGPDLPPFYTDDDALAAEIAGTGTRVHDPVWRMPLWEPYDSLLDGKISQLNNVSNGPFAGSITAALFLRRFAEGAGAWVHFDIYGWMPSTKPGRPEGGETQTARLLYELLERRVQKQA
ncbi:MAG: Leucyl aminopeptidase [Hyphomicrobiales bacterium]|nr:Leucyl aminopeptidase [Hyphomicrobiales bacterium]